MKKALIVQGGWDGHEPVETSQFIVEKLGELDYSVDISDTLDVFNDFEKLMTYDLISPHWTDGKLDGDKFKILSKVIQSGVGIAGYHGGMGDAFRDNCDYQMMVGGQFVAHPYIGPHHVYFDEAKHPIIDGMSDFEVIPTEQYYVHVDPSNIVLATTRAGAINDIVMPIAWVRSHGKGRVFYCTLGHSLEVVKQKEVCDLIIKGMDWASRKETHERDI